MLLIVHRYCFLLFVLLLIPVFLKGQGKLEVVYQVSPEDNKVLKQYRLPRLAVDSLDVLRVSRELLGALQHDGYLLASVDSMSTNEQKAGLFVKVGERYYWAHLRPGNLDEEVLSHIGYRERFYKRKPFRYKAVSRLLESIIAYSENNGFPFASVQLDSITVKQETVSAALNYQKGPLIIFDTVEVAGESKTKPLFLSRYLRIKPGQPFDERKVAQAASRLSRLPYLKVTAPPYASFQLKQGTPHLSLAEVKANHIDGVIGLLPNEGSDGGVLITGQFDLLLQNLFGTGKKIGIKWQRPQPRSQMLDMQYAHPNLFGSPVNAEAKFLLLKEDTLFLNRNLTLEASLLWGEYSSIKLYSDFKVASVIGAAFISDARRSGEYADFDLNLYGIGYDWRNLDSHFLPTRGLAFGVQGAVGNKRIKEAAGLTTDSVGMKVVQYAFEGEAQYYVPVSRRIVMKTRAQGGVLLSDKLLINDLYRIGGLNSLRGFIENEFYAANYAIGTLEGQLFLDNESYMFLFYDQAYGQFGASNKITDFPAGIGGGITFSTNAGSFTFVYALGRTSAQPFDFNFSKVHFGYITKF